MGDIGSELELPDMFWSVKDQQGRGPDVGDPIPDLIDLSLSKNRQLIDVLESKKTIKKILGFHIHPPWCFLR